VPQGFQTLPLAMGSPEFRAFLRSEKPYDYVLNFAALKHVRSERDPYSLMHMVHTNVVCLRDLLERIAPQEPKKVFSVSSDKAVNPESAMGATKALMEHLLLAYSDRIPVSSARFANVAFSDGSLLYSFGRRLEKRQPLSAPVDVRRYFISHEEAGQLCLLAGFLGRNRDIFVPKLDPSVHLLTFSEIAELYLESRGLLALPCSSEDEAKRRARELNPSGGEWPCYFFASDTTGEKMEEELFASGETVDWSRFRAIGVVTASAPDGSKTLDALEALERLRATQAWTKQAILEVLRRVVPELRHEETGRNLDQKM
jgi:FlaA1/EpsC-like NDP-sugar epimerase